MAVTAVVLAAGAGSRLGELGRRHSKAMLPVAGKALVVWVIERLRAAGVERLVVVAHAADAELRSLAGAEGAEVVSQHQRRGIADALRLALPSLPAAEPYLACACDSLFPAADIAAMVALGQGHPGAAVVGVLDMGDEATATRSAVRLEGERVVEIVEKPPPGTIAGGLVAMPLYWLPAAVAAHLCRPRADGEHYVSTALADFIAAGGTVLARRVGERLEITTAEDVAGVALRLRRDR